MSAAQQGLAWWMHGGVGRLDAYRRNVSKAMDAQTAAIQSAVAGCGAQERKLLADLHDCRQRLTGVMASRWQGQTLKRNGRNYSPSLYYTLNSSTGLATAESVVETMRELIDQLGSSRMPILASSRAHRFDGEMEKANWALSICATAEQTVTARLLTVITSTIRSTSKPAQQALDETARRWSSPPGIREGLTRSLASAPRGDGRFILQAGWASLPPPEFRVGKDSLTAGGQAALAPVFVDLDVDGGLMTDSRLAVNSLSRRMLTLLPAGQLQMKVFDPKGLGKSVRDIFAVDSVSGKVLPDKVFSTKRELEELLEKLEQLLTDVYRKYLGSRHRTLHEYNLAAGEVAEPYRLLLLYDYPSGWDRGDGQVDATLVARLAKIIEAGPACGVFTLLHYTGPQDMRSFNLPTLNSAFAQSALDAWAPALAKFPPATSANYQPFVPQTDLTETARTAGPTGLVSWRRECRWVPPGKHDVEKGATAAIMQRLATDLRQAAAVSIDSAKLLRLAQQKTAAEAKTGLRPGAAAADPAVTGTWWKGSTARRAVARFGQLGATDVAELAFDNQSIAWLIAGNPGSGKSTLLHAAVTDMCRNYSPTELELWLADLKHGVEFRPYAVGGLPHAYVVGLEAGREFGLDMLQRLAATIGERAKVFKASGGVTDLPTYRATGATMPRIIAVIDEFQGLFERDDLLAREAAIAMETLVRKGRAFGVHLVLATQQISGGGLPRSIFTMVSCRVALMSSPSDSAQILGNDANLEASELTRPGEGIINTSPSGSRDDNRRFQAINMTAQEVQSVVATSRTLAAATGSARTPIVMDATRPASMTKTDGSALRNPVTGLECRIPIGRPMGMGPTVPVVLDRAPASNVLVIGDAPCAAGVVGQMAAASLLGGLATTVLDFAGMGSDLSQALDPAAAAVQRRQKSDLRFRQPREFLPLLAKVADSVSQRIATAQFRLPPRILVLLNVNRCPAMSLDDEDRLLSILRLGPEVGVHVMVHAATPVFAERFLNYEALQLMGIRIVGDVGADSDRLTASTLAEHVPPDQLVLAVPSMKTVQTIRPFIIEPAKWGQM